MIPGFALPFALYVQSRDIYLYDQDFVRAAHGFESSIYDYAWTCQNTGTLEMPAHESLINNSILSCVKSSFGPEKGGQQKGPFGFWIVVPQGHDNDKQAADGEAGDEEEPARVKRRRGAAAGRGGPEGAGGPGQGDGAGAGELVVADGVVGEAGEGDGVAEALEEGDLGAPDDDGDDDEEDVLENAGEGHDEAGRLADLQSRLLVAKAMRLRYADGEGNAPGRRWRC